MAEETRAPRSAVVYVGAVAALGALGAAACVALLARETRWGGALAVGALDVVLAIGVAAAFAFLRRSPFTLHWREHRLVVTLDEAAVLVGLLLLPAPLLPVAILHATVFMQWWGGPKATIKRVFNVAQYAFAAVVTAALFLALGAAGVPALLAAVVASFAFGTAANLLLTGVFASLSGEGVVSIYRERFLAQGANSSLIGIAGGVTVVALWQLHPLATLSIVPFAYLVRGYWRLYAAADRELDVHRQLANAMHDLVGSASTAAVAERVMEECERLLDCGRVELTVALENGEGRERLGRSFGAGPQRYAAPMREQLPGGKGRATGEIAVWPRQGKDSFTDQERALLRTVAGQAAGAIENARAIQEAETARQRVDSYLSTAQDAVLLVDVDGWIRYLNPAARRLLGVPDDKRRHRAADFFSDPRLAMQDRALPMRPVLVEGEGRSFDGERSFLVEAHIGPVKENGRATGTLMVVRDVTERKGLEDEMVRQREALAHNEKLSTLGTLVAGVAHEINNPLTFMRGNLQLCRDGLAKKLHDASLSDADRRFVEDLADEVQVALEGVDRITAIASSLKNVSKRGSSDRKPEDLNAVVREVVAVVRTGIPRSVRLDLDLAPRLPPVSARASELHQVFLNLIKNAVEALDGRPEGHVRVRSYVQGERVVVEVSDNGCGIPPDVQKNLFTTFFTTKEKGTGLGLSLSRGIVQSHGGELTLRSEEGKGTTFIVQLPAFAAAESRVL